VQAVPITAKVVSSNPVHGEMYSIEHCVIKFVSSDVLQNETCQGVDFIFWGPLEGVGQGHQVQKIKVLER
jgi:hypothetical protein